MLAGMAQRYRAERKLRASAVAYSAGKYRYYSTRTRGTYLRDAKEGLHVALRKLDDVEVAEQLQPELTEVDDHKPRKKPGRGLTPLEHSEKFRRMLLTGFRDFQRNR